MPMTLTEKILADHADKSEVHPGELVRCLTPKGRP